MSNLCAKFDVEQKKASCTQILSRSCSATVATHIQNSKKMWPVLIIVSISYFANHHGAGSSDVQHVLNNHNLFLITKKVLMKIKTHFQKFLYIQDAQAASRIVNGTRIDIKYVPYQVQIGFKQSLICGGSIIGPKHILTAAHCFP